MQQKRFWFSVVSVWLVMFLTDWVFHGVWLKELYMSTPQLWKPADQIEMWKSWFANAIWAWAFVWIYTKGLSQDNPWNQAFRYAWAMWLVAKVPALIGQWGWAAYPPEILWKWGVVAFVQTIGCAFVMTWVYKPAWAPAPQRH